MSCLQAGQCLIFAPTAVVAKDSSVDDNRFTPCALKSRRIKTAVTAVHLGRGYMVAKMRQRVTVDCGKSLLATDALPKEA